MNPSFSRTVLVMMALQLTVAACNAPKKALNRGDYEQAVRLSVDKLRSNPSNKSARQVLAESWPRAVRLHEERIATFQSSSEPFRWEKVVGSYEQLNAMTTMLQRCPACESVVPSYKLYVDEVGDARRRAAQARYDAGIASLDPNSRERSRTAYEHFMVVERMMPDYRDTRARMPDGTMVDVFNRVEAKFTRFKKTVVSRGLVDMQIVDSHNGRVILQEKIPGEFVWIAEWATFNGDERALNTAQRQLAQRREVPSPAPQDLFIMFTGPIYDQVTDRLRRFYNR